MTDNKNQYDGLHREYVDQEKEFAKANPEDRDIVFSRIGNPAGKKLLDIGCGNGIDAGNFYEQGAKVTGVDISSNMLEVAKNQYPEVEFLKKDFTSLDLPEDSFDMVFSRFAIHYAIKPEDVFKEIHKVLKKGGTAYILLAHPLLLFYNKEVRDYHKQEIVSLPISQGLVVKESSHTFNEYMTPYVLENFWLKYFTESIETTVELEEGGKIPTFFYIELQKR